jgi:hypothetical protein
MILNSVMIADHISSFYEILESVVNISSIVFAIHPHITKHLEPHVLVKLHGGVAVIVGLDVDLLRPGSLQAVQALRQGDTTQCISAEICVAAKRLYLPVFTL